MKLNRCFQKYSLLISSALIALAPLANATDYTWATNSGSWESASWVGSPAVNPATGPVSTDNIVGSGLNVVLSLEGNRSVDQVSNQATGTWTMQSISIASLLTANNIINGSTGRIAFRAALVGGSMSVDAGNITQSGSGYINLGNIAVNNRIDSLTVSGTTTVSSGSININVDNSLAIDPDTYSLGFINVADTGFLRLNQVNYVKSGTVVANSAGLIGTGGQIMNSSNAGAVGTSSSLVVTTTGTYSSGTVLLDGDAGTLSLTKSGAGTQTLTGDSTYTGATNVNAGTLLINGNNSAATGAVTVGVNGTLGGSNGNIGGATTVNGILSPGTSPGILTFSNGGNALTLAATANTIMEIVSNTPGSGHDQIVLSNALSTLTYGGTLTLNIGALISDGTFDLFSFSTESAPLASNFSSILFSGGGYSGSFADNGGGIWTATSNGQNFTFTETTGDLSVATVPEPSTFAMILGGAGLLTLLRRRRG